MALRLDKETSRSNNLLRESKEKDITIFKQDLKLVVQEAAAESECEAFEQNFVEAREDWEKRFNRCNEEWEDRAAQEKERAFFMALRLDKETSRSNNLLNESKEKDITIFKQDVKLSECEAFEQNCVEAREDWEKRFNRSNEEWDSQLQQTVEKWKIELEQECEAMREERQRKEKWQRDAEEFKAEAVQLKRDLGQAEEDRQDAQEKQEKEQRKATEEYNFAMVEFRQAGEEAKEVAVCEERLLNRAKTEKESRQDIKDMKADRVKEVNAMKEERRQEVDSMKAEEIKLRKELAEANERSKMAVEQKEIWNHFNKALPAEFQKVREQAEKKAVQTVKEEAAKAKVAEQLERDKKANAEKAARGRKVSERSKERELKADAKVVKLGLRYNFVAESRSRAGVAK